jgi:hypothetical protein
MNSDLVIEISPEDAGISAGGLSISSDDAQAMGAASSDVIALHPLGVR